MNSLVKNELVPSYSDAADIIVTGFQNGADRGQDLLDTLNEYGSTFSELGISGEGALSLINSGLDAGIDNSDRIADALRESGIRLREISTDPAMADAFKQLDDLSQLDLAGMLDAYNQGTLSGDDFWRGFFAAFGEANAVDPEATAPLAAKLIGTQSEDFGPTAISQLTTTWDDSMGAIEGRAETAGNTISNTLGTAISTFMRVAEEAAADFLSSEQLDLPGKIELLKTGLYDAIEVLNSGGSVSEALTVGLKPIGFDDEFQKLEDILGRFVIAILGLVADVQDILGKDSSGTRQEVSRLSAQQLTYELQISNPEDFTALLNDAFQQGLNPTDYAGALEDSISQLVESGDFQKAQDLLDMAKRTTVSVLPGQDVGQISADIQAARDAAQAAIDEAKNAAIEAAKPRAVTAFGGSFQAEGGGNTFSGFGGTAQIDEGTANNVTTTLDAFEPEPVQGVFTAFDTLSQTSAPQTISAFDSATLSVDTLTGSTDTLDSQMIQTADTMTAVNEAQNAAANNTQDYVGAVQQATLATSEFGQGLAAAIAQAQAQINSMAGSAGGDKGTPGKASGGAATGTFMVGEQGRELVTTDRSLAVLNNQSTEAIMAALNGFIPGAGGRAGGGTRNTTLNQYNVVNSQAEASALGYETARQVRGM